MALDPDDGKELWRFQSPAAQRSPGSVTGSGVVVLLTGDQDDAELVGVDALTGVERWRVPERLTVLGSTDDVVAVERFSDLAGSEPVRGIDRETGDELWVSDVGKNDMSGQYGAVGTSAVWHELLIVPGGTAGQAVEYGTDGVASAINLDTGAVEWTSADLGTPLAADTMVIGGGPLDGLNATIHGVDPLTGRGAWSAPGRTAYGGYIAAGDGIVVADGDMGLVAYDQATGTEKWHAADGFDPHGIANGKVISLWEAALEARSIADGAVAWQFIAPFGSPFMDNLTTNSTAVFVAINSLPWTD
jgi:outer membrane protein assembly factor BamB